MRKAYHFLENKLRPLDEWLFNNWLKLLAFILVFGVISLAAYLRFFKGYGWADWVGFDESIETLIPPTPGTPSIEYRPAKTVWDWLELLIIPVVLAFSALWFNSQERKSDREIAADRQQETALQAFFDKMTELLLDKGLRTSKKDSEVRAVATARTLTTLRALDGERKSTLIRFLIDASLLQKEDNVINLKGANIQKINLEHANLVGANLKCANLELAFLKYSNLSEANLERANLAGARLIEANLEGANLAGACLVGTSLARANLAGVNFEGANLTRVFLKGAKRITPKQLEQVASLKGAIMPDGTIHE